jgi:hypothetical protein
MKNNMDIPETNEDTDPEVFQTTKEYKRNIREFMNNRTHMIVTSRFTTSTMEENNAFRKRNPKAGCIYCSPFPITEKFTDMVLFVLEMNNTTNRIDGIGMIRNKAVVNKYKVYEHGSYNRYTYIGKYRISREEVTEEEEQIMQVFDTLCFKGYTNMKRGKGITAFSAEILYKCVKHMDLVEYIRKMFNARMYLGVVS